MVTILKKGFKKAEIEKALVKKQKIKAFNAHKHCGIIKLEEDPVEIQKKMRNE